MLDNLIKKGRIPSSVLLTGNDAVRLEEEALRFAREITSSVDIFSYKPEGKLALHSLEKMRSLKEDVYLPPFQGKKKVFLILEAEKMWKESSNALLKTFEEPPETALIILTSSQPQKILPTLLSRCQKFRIAEPEKELKTPLLDDIFAHGPYEDYREFQAAIKKITSEIENKRKLFESEFVDAPDSTASMKEMQEKENEGTSQLWYLNEMKSLYEAILRKHRHSGDLIQEAKTKIERSISLTAILESLFIKLGYL